METLRLYYKLVGMAFKSMTQFRIDFLVGLVGVIVQNGVNLLAIGVLLGRFHDLAGWTVWEIVFLYGLWMVGNSLLFLHLSGLEYYILEGTFDRFLVRPLSPFLQLLGEEVNMNGIADVIFGLASLGLAMVNLKLHFNLEQWAFMLIALFSAALIELGLTLGIASLAFWTGRSGALALHGQPGELEYGSTVPAGNVRARLPHLRHLFHPGGVPELLPSALAAGEDCPR